MGRGLSAISPTSPRARSRGEAWGRSRSLTTFDLEKFDRDAEFFDNNLRVFAQIDP